MAACASKEEGRVVEPNSEREDQRPPAGGAACPSSGMAGLCFYSWIVLQFIAPTCVALCSGSRAKRQVLAASKTPGRCVGAAAGLCSHLHPAAAVAEQH